MGEIGVGRAGETLVTLLGSCVAVVLFDRHRKTAAMAHIQLPVSLSTVSARIDGPGKFADTAIPQLLQHLSSPVPSRLVAHVAGGADMFVSSRDPTIGQLNIQATKRLLNELSIPLASSDFGGTRARRLRFEVDTGELQIEIIQLATEGGV